MKYAGRKRRNKRKMRKKVVTYVYEVITTHIIVRRKISKSFTLVTEFFMPFLQKSTWDFNALNPLPSIPFKF